MSQDNVARLPTREPASEVPALGMSIQVDLGLGRVATLQTFVPSDASQVEVNRMLDKMTRAGDRQRAHYRLEELHRDLLEEQRKHVQMQADQQANIVAFNETQQKRQREIEQREKALINYHEARKAVDADTGRRNPSEPKGAVRANLERLETAVKEGRQAIVDADLAHASERANYEGSLTTHQKAIERIEKEIARCEGIEAAGLAE